MKAPDKKFAIYVSTKSENPAERERQEASCWALAEEFGWEVAEVYSDTGKTANRPLRPGYQSMCANLRAGTLQGVLAYDATRLCRGTRDLETFIDLVDATGTEVHMCYEWIDLSTPTGRLSARSIGANASYWRVNRRRP